MDRRPDDLGSGVEHTRLGTKLMSVYNDRGIFSNLTDDRESLTRALASRFDRYQVEVVGAVALFAGIT